ncbi:DUF523 domain-containing protein [Streptodolium elevatio]|uniref:DUF523 domain-containing protein n=1 Tax=Streptodolium elevatio TaxID=3157996 RepID=A0ABV3DB22_9ACTN
MGAATPAAKPAATKHKVLVSRCLLGHRVRYDGGTQERLAVLAAWEAEGRIVPVCPEVEGGLPTPRPRAEIPGGRGAQVLDGTERVLTHEGADVTGPYLEGARICLELAARHGIRVAVLKARSPSCGNREAYDGTFTGTRVTGEGVAAAALRRAGVRVFNEDELDAARAALEALDHLDDAVRPPQPDSPTTADDASR